MLRFGLWEAGTSLAAGIFGIIGYIGLLQRKRWGGPLIWIMLLCVVASIVVGFVQLPYALENMKELSGQQEIDEEMLETMRTVALATAGLFTAFRVTLGVLVIVALVKATRWFDQRELEVSEDFA